MRAGGKNENEHGLRGRRGRDGDDDQASEAELGCSGGWLKASAELKGMGYRKELAGVGQGRRRVGESIRWAGSRVAWGWLLESETVRWLRSLAGMR